MKGADLEDAEGLAEHLIAEFPETSLRIRKIFCAPWYPKVLDGKKRLSILQPEIEESVTELIEKNRTFTEKIRLISIVRSEQKPQPSAMKQEDREAHARRRTNEALAAYTEEKWAKQAAAAQEDPLTYHQKIWNTVYQGFLSEY